MWLRSIGIVLISACSGQLVGRSFGKIGMSKGLTLFFGLAIMAGLICMMIGDWLMRNVLLKDLTDIKKIFNEHKFGGRCD